MIPIHTFLDLARARRSVRRYKPGPVPEGLLREVVEAARWAPSAVNLQPWEFIIVTDPEVKAQVGRNARYFGLRWPHIHEAPALIVVCARNVSKFSRDDCIFAGSNIMLAATDRGLGTCWIGGFDEKVIREILAVPEDFILPGFCTIGYAEGDTDAPPKRPLDEMLHRNTFQGRRGGLRRLRGPLEALRRVLKLQGRRGQKSDSR